MPGYCEWCAEPTYPGAWTLLVEFLRILITVKAVCWMLSLSTIFQRRSPRLRPSEVGHELLLRKRLMTLNWKLLANKARALYYTKRAHSHRRRITREGEATTPEPEATCQLLRSPTV